MAEIKPFSALRYDPDEVDLARVVAPPYDVLDEEDRQRHCERDEHNVVRLTLGTDPLTEAPPPSRYRHAADQLRQWLGGGVLTRDAEPALYVWEQTYRIPVGMLGPEGELMRRGFVALLKLEPLGQGTVFPHETTLAAPKADRLNLRRTCQVAFSPLYLIYTDPQCRADEALAAAQPTQPLLHVTDVDGTRHGVFAVTDGAAIEATQEALREQKLVIADGHHRYETALHYRDEMRQKTCSQDGPWEYVLVYLCNTEGNEVTILPSHRVVRGVPAEVVASLADRARELFEVERVPLGQRSGDRLARAGQLLSRLHGGGRARPVFGVYTGAAEGLLLRARPEALSQGLLSDVSPAARSLDIVLLHKLVIDRVLSVELRREEPGRNIYFTRSADKLMRWVDTGGGRVGLLLNPARVEQVIEMALAGERMPQKGTYFYPKLLSGAVMYDMCPERAATE